MCGDAPRSAPGFSAVRRRLHEGMQRTCRGRGGGITGMPLGLTPAARASFCSSWRASGPTRCPSRRTAGECSRLSRTSAVRGFTQWTFPPRWSPNVRGIAQKAVEISPSEADRPVCCSRARGEVPSVNYRCAFVLAMVRARRRVLSPDSAQSARSLRRAAVAHPPHPSRRMAPPPVPRPGRRHPPPCKRHPEREDVVRRRPAHRSRSHSERLRIRRALSRIAAPGSTTSHRPGPRHDG